ncbi:glycosyl transferase [Candidatus Atribacteria bacterium HGW-Atribacteria-1]|nr:MAG: glycosyl transferase [Candidatus Atribacteria bacterium HGW-Atribacteria-1]
MSNICILTTVHPPFDTRIFHKEAKSLVKAGYKVTLIVQHSKNEVVGGVKIIALPKPRNRFMRIFGLSWRALYLTLSQKADIYHFHDPELIIVGIILKVLGKKVIYDVHEDVPKQIMNKNWLGNNRIRIFAAFIMNIVEQIGSLLFNKIVVATPDIAKKFPKNKTIILRNFSILELIDNTVPINYKKNKPVIIYAGGLTKIRGIKEIIQVSEYIEDRAELWLLGKWESEEFKKECENLKGWEYTKYLGLKNLEEVYSFMKFSDIAIINFLPAGNNLKAGPNKIYEYMACSLPIVMSNFPYWKGMFKECALFADPYIPKDIAEKVLYLLDTPDEAKKMGRRGRKLIEEKYSWEAESKKLLEMYENL